MSEDREFDLCCYEHCGLGEYDGDHDEFDWDDFAVEVHERYMQALQGFDRIDLASIFDVPLRLLWPGGARHIWWVLLGGHPHGLEIIEVSTHDDVWSSGLFGIPRYPYPHRLVIDSTVELKLGGERWPVKSYVLSRPGDDSPAYLHSVLANQPPDFGWWMPSLKEPW